MKKQKTMIRCVLNSLLVVSAAAYVFAMDQIDENKPPPEPYIIGHRGAADLAPENTLAAFRRRFELGLDAVELDVQLSSDGAVIVYHDLTLKPEITSTSDREWLDMWKGLPIKDLSLDELKTVFEGS